MTKRRNHVALIGCGFLLAGCNMPFFANDVHRIDWKGPPVAGTIAVSQPKMYRRESLINERREEVKWLNEELDHSRTVTFEPELIRETEQIKQLAAALGLSFDPASALNYRRAAATGEIEQQIDVLKLQMQLDQLRRDTELLHAALPGQNAPVNADLGKVTSAGPAPATSSAGAAAADKLAEAIDRIDKSLTARLDATAQAPARAASGVNPADLFRDRAAYRDLIKAARNAASLDDLHDYGGRALVRLNFQAMVLPEPHHLAAPGVVQMTVQRPVFSQGEKAQVYRRWLEHLNRKINRVTATGWEPDSELVYSRAADNFDLVAFGYPSTVAMVPTPAAGKAAPKKFVSVQAAPVPAVPACAGYARDPAHVDAACAVLVFAVPKFTGGSLQEGAYSSLNQYIEASTRGTEIDDSDEDIAVHKSIVALAPRLVHACGLPAVPPVAPGQPRDVDQKLFFALADARTRVATGEEYARVERQAQQMLARRGLAPLPATPTSRAIATRAARARFLLRTFEQAAYADCPEEARVAFRAAGPAPYIPPGFAEALESDPRVAVYEVGPREQVQQVSTVARVANNLSLALAAAASAPGTGLGASAAANYSRQAIGRAAAIERVPGLIGYATSNDATDDKVFGWVVAPKAVMDPKGTILLEQIPRTLDLSVELSVPGWWPMLTLVSRSGWAPDVATITEGTFTMEKHQTFSVPIAPNYADFDDLTALIQHGVSGVTHEAALDEASLRDQFVAGCRATSLYLRGANIWRATAVVIGGYLMDETAITLAPDMSGILVAVPPLDGVVGRAPAAGNDGKSKLKFSVFTRYGDVSGDVDYVPKPVPDGCKEQDKSADPDTPVITSVRPTEFKGGTELWFTVEGSKLDKFDSVTINGQPGKIVHAAKDGKSIQAKFEGKQTQGLPISRTIPLSFYAGGKKLGERLVENRN